MQYRRSSQSPSLRLYTWMKPFTQSVPPFRPVALDSSKSSITSIIYVFDFGNVVSGDHKTKLTLWLPVQHRCRPIIIPNIIGHYLCNMNKHILAQQIVHITMSKINILDVRYYFRTLTSQLPGSITRWAVDYGVITAAYIYLYLYIFVYPKHTIGLYNLENIWDIHLLSIKQFRKWLVIW